MAKEFKDIVKWGVVRPFLDKTYDFNTIDIETVDNELFLLGYIDNDRYFYHTDKFYKRFNDLLIRSVQNRKDILTWSRYDNTHLIKLLLQEVDDVNKILLRIGKISPIFTYKYNGFEITIVNIIKDSIIFRITDFAGRGKNVVIYNLKNLFTSDLETTAKDYKITYYTKLGIEFHIIDKDKFDKDSKYKENVITANILDNRVLLDIAYQFLENFKRITDYYPKTIFTAGSVARSYLLSFRANGNPIDLHFRSTFGRIKHRNKLLDYSMKSYHGGKIESYILGYVKSGYIIDKTSAYPHALANLPKLTNKINYQKGDLGLNKYFYAFIKCNIFIENEKLIHPLIVESPINRANVSPYGFIKEIIITKPEYDYMIDKGAKIKVIDYLGIEHLEIYPYKDLVMSLFNNRMLNRKSNPALADLFKTILNSLYGITFELTDVYTEIDGNIEWEGYRAGDYFNPVIASYITALTRTDLSNVANNITENGGEVYLIMTDSIIFNGKCDLDIFTENKILGTYNIPEKLTDIMILGAGRYEYFSNDSNKYTIKSRGFSVSEKDSSFYTNLDFSSDVKINHKTFVSAFKATTKKFDVKQMGYLIDDDYSINPFNLGGKRIIENYDIDLKKEFTKTKPLYLDKSLY